MVETKARKKAGKRRLAEKDDKRKK